MDHSMDAYVPTIWKMTDTATANEHDILVMCFVSIYKYPSWQDFKTCCSCHFPLIFFCNATVFACFCTMPRCSEMWSLQVCQHEHPQVQQMRFQLQSLLWFSNGSLTKNWLGPLVVDDVGSWNDGTWLLQPIINRRPRPGRNMSSSE